MLSIDKGLWILHKHLGELLSIDSTDTDSLASYLHETGACVGSRSDILERIENIRAYRTSLKELQAQPQVAQRTPEWYELRKNRLTASDAAQAMEKGKFGSRAQLVTKKAFPELHTVNMSSPPLKWGTMFEPMATRCYSQRNNDMIIHEFGLIPHPTIPCFGASPDGITELGIMVEYKCPFKRQITGEVLEQYEIQMQGQMAVCGLKECDFVECDMERLSDKDAYVASMAANANTDHGIILEYNTDTDKYLYSPAYLTTAECLDWMGQQPTGYVTVYFWRLRKISIQRVMFDEKRWLGMVPTLLDFWKDVELARTQAPPALKVQANEVVGKGWGGAGGTTVYDFIPDDDDTSVP